MKNKRLLQEAYWERKPIPTIKIDFDKRIERLITHLPKDKVKAIEMLELFFMLKRKKKQIVSDICPGCGIFYLGVGKKQLSFKFDEFIN